MEFSPLAPRSRTAAAESSPPIAQLRFPFFLPVFLRADLRSSVSAVRLGLRAKLFLRDALAYLSARTGNKINCFGERADYAEADTAPKARAGHCPRCRR